MTTDPLRRLQGVAVNGGISLLSIALTLAFFEAVARLFDEAPGPPNPALYTEYDPLLGWRHRPGAQVEFPQGAYSINSLGLRDEERGYETHGAQRVLVLGDSFAEGFSVRFEDSVSQVLERRLREGRCAVDVVNGGVAGYSTDQEFLYYRRELWRYDARVVLLFFFYNDIIGNVSDSIGLAPKPRFAPEEPLHLVRETVPPPERQPSREIHLHAPYPFGSAALEWSRKRLSTWPSVYSFCARLGLWEPPVVAGAPIELKVFEAHVPRADRLAWRCTARLLRALAEEVAGHGARLLVVYVPSKMEVSDRDWGLTILEYGLDRKAWDREAVARHLQSLGAEDGFPVLDLTPALRRADSPVFGGPFHDHGGHWNALGHRVAAEEVARYLAAAGWMGACQPGPIP